ncbi:MAG: BspA family leucine-rich repeat surface protein, partial [Alloprevotella sp.]
MTKALFHLRQFRLLLLVLLCALFSLPLSAQEAYVLEREGGSTLTFYYDNYRDSRSGKTWGIYLSGLPDWAGTYNSPNERTKRVVFDASFKDYRPTTTKYWFVNLRSLTTIDGLENLNTSEVTDMSAMFFLCSGLTSLNLSNFNTSKVTNMSGMFQSCSGLKELNVSNFNTSKMINMSYMFYGCSSLKTIFSTGTWRSYWSKNMFKGCTQLKGAVKYDESKVDETMANPTTGYFSQKLPSAIGRVVF